MFSHVQNNWQVIISQLDKIYMKCPLRFMNGLRVSKEFPFRKVVADKNYKQHN